MFHPFGHPQLSATIQLFGMNCHHDRLTQTLINSFTALAEEVQVLTDQKTILEHKLRLSHEQFQFLADKYATAAPGISRTLANLHIPPDLQSPVLKTGPRASLSARHGAGFTSLQVAVVIRDGRRAADQLSSLGHHKDISGSSCDLLVPSPTSMSTPVALEEDCTVPGQQNRLNCPFASRSTGEHDVAPHHSVDPICAALAEEEADQQGSKVSTVADRCPIRFLDLHSPQEIAHYVETHKHEIPRSHEICVARYQRNEDEIKKLDAKYGSLATLIQELSELHKPWLPMAATVGAITSTHHHVDAEAGSNKRIETWARAISSLHSDDDAAWVQPHETSPTGDAADGGEWEGQFDRPLREVRVGESPSRPGGIIVPLVEAYRRDRPEPPSSPVLPTDTRMLDAVHQTEPSSDMTGVNWEDHRSADARMQEAIPSAQPDRDAGESITQSRSAIRADPYGESEPSRATASQRPIIFNAADASAARPSPHMIFTGPVFVGYPVDQAIEIMKHYRPQTGC